MVPYFRDVDFCDVGFRDVGFRGFVYCRFRDFVYCQQYGFVSFYVGELLLLESVLVDV